MISPKKLPAANSIYLELACMNGKWQGSLFPIHNFYFSGKRPVQTVAFFRMLFIGSMAYIIFLTSLLFLSEADNPSDNKMPDMITTINFILALTFHGNRNFCRAITISK